MITYTNIATRNVGGLLAMNRAKKMANLGEASLKIVF